MKKFYLITVGCQMNVLDSELAAAQLISAGYGKATSQKEADILLFNTCSVREHAEEKIYSALGRLKHWKEYHPDGVIGVMGCMAQKDRRLIFRRAPHVDLVLGPGQLDRLPALIASVFAGEGPQMAVSIDRFHRTEKGAESVKESFRQYDPIRLPETRYSPYQAMVRIMFGCDKFCSYCVVPSVRGPEQSRPIEEIVREVETLAGQGCLEVVLLGQTVNNYRYQEGGKTYHLADLLEKINDVDGIRRIRFVSNYPTGMTDELLTAVRDLPKAMPFLHVPAQHGADSVLKRMRRQYSVAEYRDLVDRIYATIPDAAITSDFIVGFCGETEEEFQQTADLIRYCRFKNSFIFKYSPRKGTKSAELFEDDVPESVKRRRNNELLAVQNEICADQNDHLIGRKVEILVEGASKNFKKNATPPSSSAWEALQSPSRDDYSEPEGKETPVEKGNLLPLISPEELSVHGSDGKGTRENDGKGSGERVIQLTGRTPGDRIVVFDGPESLIGSFQTMEIVDATPFTLFGKRVD